MADVDYEAEYNNRARVPEHAEIFLRWAGEAEDYRAERLKAGRAELALRRERRQLDEEKRKLELQVERRLQEEILRVREVRSAKKRKLIGPS